MASPARVDRVTMNVSEDLRSHRRPRHRDVCWCRRPKLTVPTAGCRRAVGWRPLEPHLTRHRIVDALRRVSPTRVTVNVKGVDPELLRADRDGGGIDTDAVMATGARSQPA
jgi:hypothetical protein